MWLKVFRALPNWIAMGASSYICDMITYGVYIPPLTPIPPFCLPTFNIPANRLAFWHGTLKSHYLLNGALR